MRTCRRIVPRRSSDQRTTTPLSVALLDSVGTNRAPNQPKPSDQQHQHYKGLEKTRRLEKDVHVCDYARENEKRSGSSECPANCASAIPEHHGNTKQHRQKRYAKSVRAVKAPVRTHNLNLVGYEISSNTSHGEANQKFAQAARCATNISEG